MKARWIFVGVALAALIAPSVGYAVAGSPQQGTCRQQIAREHGLTMQQHHSQLSAANKARCDQLHAQLMNGPMGTEMIGSNGMMGGHHAGSMMGGSGSFATQRARPDPLDAPDLPSDVLRESR